MTADMQISPAVVRVILFHAEASTVAQAARSASVSRRQVVRWQEKRARLGGQWPTDADIAEWRERQQARAAIREKTRALKAAERERVRLGLGPQHIDPMGTRRRLQGLFALGFTAVDVGHELGVSPSRVMQLAVGYWEKTHVDTAARVADLYKRWSMPIPASWGGTGVAMPTGWRADRQRRWAKKKGWAPPLAWEDDTIDDPNSKPVGVEFGGRRVKDETLDEAAIERRLAGDRDIRLHRGERYFKVAEIRRGVAA